MSIKYIRKYYGVPAKRGGKIVFTDSKGYDFHCKIKSANNAKLKVSVDAIFYEHKNLPEPPLWKFRDMYLHPTWNIIYL